MEPNPDGRLWVEELSDVWDYLAEYPRLGEVAAAHRGIEWRDDQSRASSDERFPGYRRGLRTIQGSLKQFVIGKTEWLDCRKESLRRRAIELPWPQPKVIANSVRISRGPWRLAAVEDCDGLVASQQFFGVWPKTAAGWGLEAITALLNGPLANAFVAIHSPAKRILVGDLKSIPLPWYLDHARLRALLADYAGDLRLPMEMDAESRRQGLVDRLMAIDAEILKGYDLPPRLERMLLEYFRGHERPVAHGFRHWLPVELTAYIPLHEHLDAGMKDICHDWVTPLFRPLPQDENEALEGFLD